MATAAKQSKPNQSREQSGQQSNGADAAKDIVADYEEMREDFQTLVDEVGNSVSTYCKKRPGMAACLLFTVGFYVGWKIKPW